MFDAARAALYKKSSTLCEEARMADGETDRLRKSIDEACDIARRDERKRIAEHIRDHVIGFAGVLGTVEALILKALADEIETDAWSLSTVRG
jgi:hypothetical protein